MQLTKRGNPPQEKVYPGTCSVWRSEYEAASSELDIRTDQRFGFFVVPMDCEVCQQSSVVYFKQK